MILYDYFRSSASYRVRIALSIKGISYEKREIHLLNNGGEQFSPEYSTINPQQLVPTLVDGDAIITQSLAIIGYVEEKYPQLPTLLPGDFATRAMARSLALTIACDIHPLNNLRVLNFLKNEFDISDEQKNTWYQHWIATGFQAIESYLQQRKNPTPFCFGETPSISDVCLIPQVYNAKRYACDLTPFPLITGIYDHALTFPAFYDTRPE